jgi:uncharacterized protein (TIGR03663 family)
MKSPGKCCVLILAATIVALALRLPRLAQRPMHGDEAVHAVKFADLLEKGRYEYNPREYHGPTLNYFTLIPAWLSSAKNLGQVNEFTLRIVPVFFGLLLILLLPLVASGLGRRVSVCVAFFTAVSPAMVFYSRYYIQEMLLVCFTFGAIVAGYRYTRTRHILWAILTGVFLGLMHATKETCIIAFGAMFLALLLTLLIRGRKGGSFPASLGRVKLPHILAGLAAGLLVSALFYSSFLAHPAGIGDSFRTYVSYLGRAGNRLHVHQWHYYLQMLVYFRYADGPIWTEVVIVILAVVGFVAAVTAKGLPSANIHLLRFIAFYTAVMTVVYSVIPYKTPWCLLGFLHGMILLAGLGAVVLVNIAPNVLPRLIVICLLVESSIHLTWQAYQASYTYCADSRNPYVYAHPTEEVFTIARFAEDAARVHPDGYRMKVQVVCPGHDYWPLPWYLRKFEVNSSVYWWDGVPVSGEALNEVPPAPLVIASSDVEKLLVAWLLDWVYVRTPLEERQMYFPLFEKPYYIWLRPQVKLVGFIRKDLRDGIQPPDPAAKKYDTAQQVEK